MSDRRTARRRAAWPYIAGQHRDHAQAMAAQHRGHQQRILDAARRIEAHVRHPVIRELARAIQLDAAETLAALTDIELTMMQAAQLGRGE